MDPIIFLILTVTLNGLVTGVLIFYFQRRIESKLGRQNFEHQTKFSDIYAKRVKALEDIFQKFIALESTLLAMYQNTQAFMELKPKDQKPYADHKGVQAKFEVFQHSFEVNRLYLSEKAAEVVLGVFVMLVPVKALIGIIASNPLMKSVPSAWMEMLPELGEMKGFEGADLTEPEILLKRLMKEVSMCGVRLENLYEDEVGLKA